MKTIEIAILVAVVVIAAFFLFNCKINCQKMMEGYIATPMNSGSPLKRSPVNNIYYQNGQTGNPHYHADPANKMIPLEVAYTDFWRPVVAAELPPITRQDVELINDDRLRMDAYAFGDIGFAKMLDNEPLPNSGSIPIYFPYEMDVSIPEPFAPLYSAEYHMNAVFGQ